MPVAGSVQRPELARALGTDGKEYVVRPAEFSLTELEAVWQRFKSVNLGLDDIGDWEEFTRWLYGARPVWFEVVDVSSGAQIGLIYLSDFVPMWAGGEGYAWAHFHAIVWDSNAATRLPVVRAFIPTVFRLFKLHRLEAQIPLNKGGAIRVVKKLGFKEEGRLREVRRHHGQWWDALVLSLLDHEVTNGTGSTEVGDTPDRG